MKLIVMILSIMAECCYDVSFMLTVLYAYCRKLALYTECCYAKCRYAECRGAAFSILTIAILTHLLSR
jgi:hypothetical protein